MTISSRTKVAMGILLLLVAGSALAFWKKTPTTDEPALLPIDHSNSGEFARSLPSSDGESRYQVPPASTPDPNQSDGSEFTPNYHHSFHSADGLRKPLDEDLMGVDEEPKERRPHVKMPIINLGTRTHVVVDGDTLSQLAAHYLGNSDRYLDIYAANRKILSSPDLLPIGAVLEIPPAKQTNASQESDSESGDLPLVPVPEGALNGAK